MADVSPVTYTELPRRDERPTRLQSKRNLRGRDTGARQEGSSHTGQHYFSRLQGL